MRKQSKSFKSMVKKLTAPVILLFGLVLGFVVDRVTSLLTSHNHVAASEAAAKPAPALAVCPPAPEHKAKAPAQKLVKVGHAHRKHAHKPTVAAAKKHKPKKAQQRVASK